MEQCTATGIHVVMITGEGEGLGVKVRVTLGSLLPSSWLLLTLR